MLQACVLVCVFIFVNLFCSLLSLILMLNSTILKFSVSPAIFLTYFLRTSEALLPFLPRIDSLNFPKSTVLPTFKSLMSESTYVES